MSELVEINNNTYFIRENVLTNSFGDNYMHAYIIMHIFSKFLKIKFKKWKCWCDLYIYIIALVVWKSTLLLKTTYDF